MATMTAQGAGTAHRRSWKTLAAFAIIYFVWGSTFLAIRIGVQEIPPVLFAALRFFTAGVLLSGWMFATGQPNPTRREWLSIFSLGLVIFVFDYGLLFWAEQRVPSGAAAVLLATIPVFMTLSEIVFLRTRKLTLGLAGALLIGLAGVAILVSRSLLLGGAPLDRAGSIALIISAISWSIASAMTRKFALPESKALSAGTQMLAGGALLLVVAFARGETHNFHLASLSRGVWIALLYLIFAGSILAFTAYVWLLHRESPTLVGTYAYVNPLVAVALGYFFAQEPIGMRTLLGTALVLVSVLLITMSKKFA